MMGTFHPAALLRDVRKRPATFEDLKSIQAKARELGLYMQKYCGCVFSEEERYAKQIARDKEKYS